MTLDDLRDKLDLVDDKIITLLQERFALVENVAEVKKRDNIPTLHSSREREIINRLTKDKDESMSQYIQILYTMLFDLSRSHQGSILNANSETAEKIKTALAETPPLFPKNASVACQGIEGANSTAACDKLFSRPSIMYFETFDAVCSAVNKGLCKYGILPIENSLHGSVTAVYDLMKKHDFHIARSIKLKINHTLLAKNGVKVSDIKKVYSHEQALAQCSDVLDSLKVEIVPCQNTAIAAKIVSESDDKTIAAISSKQCAELYSLNMLSDEIQNNENNYTKFICISKDLQIYPGSNRISLMLKLTHKPGSLYHLMAKFAALGVNLTKLESRPLPEKDFEFMFYFDLDVSVYDEALFHLFADLEANHDVFVFLGCYSEV